MKHMYKYFSTSYRKLKVYIEILILQPVNEQSSSGLTEIDQDSRQKVFSYPVH